MSRRKTGDMIAGVICILIGMNFVVGSIPLGIGSFTEPAPGFFPFVAGLFLSILAAILFIRAWFGQSTGTEPFGALKRPAVAIFGLLSYSLILDPLGFVIATFMLSILVLLIMKVRRWWKIALASFVVSTGSYLVFAGVLDINLPPGILSGLV